MSEQVEPPQTSSLYVPSTGASDEHARALAEEAYVFGYPMVYNLAEMIGMTTASKTRLAAPVNLFAHAHQLATPQDHFVSINNDTLYSVAVCDVTREPLVLHVPDTHGRYYVMQFVDVWTNNFAYVGRRATGVAEGAYLLIGPDWTGAVTTELRVIRAPSDVFAIVGRFAVDGPVDVPTVAALQRGTWLTPLSRHPEPPEGSARRMGDWDLAPWDTRAPEALRFWEQLRAWMRRFPPAHGDRAYVQTLAPLGLLEPRSPYVDMPAKLADALCKGAQAGQERIEAATRYGQATPVNGWQSGLHTFDYNLDYFELGAINAPEWKVADRSEAYQRRASAARGGLWGNHGYEAAYFTVYVDDKGEQLNGARRYTLHFDHTPPVDAFWSVTMYDMPEYYLVANPINRYSIGDRTPGLRYNANGSLDIVIQHEQPSGESANWLPAPEGDFRPVLRMYQPREEVWRGKYILPAIHRVG